MDTSTSALIVGGSLNGLTMAMLLARRCRRYSATRTDSPRLPDRQHIGLVLSSIRTIGQTHWFAAPHGLEAEHEQLNH